ncbi:MAG: hypothetical protein ACRDHN_15480 [Thermomicrobiales bacterium]
MKTSGFGWRVVAAGVFFLLLGSSMLFNSTGPLWISGGMVVIGALAMVAGRRM